MSNKIVWEDITRKQYTMEQITNEHLLNIMDFLEAGKGYWEYRGKETFDLMKNEIKKRKLQYNR